MAQPEAALRGRVSPRRPLPDGRGLSVLTRQESPLPRWQQAGRAGRGADVPRPQRDCDRPIPRPSLYDATMAVAEGRLDKDGARRGLPPARVPGGLTAVRRWPEREGAGWNAWRWGCWGWGRSVGRGPAARGAAGPDRPAVGAAGRGQVGGRPRPGRAAGRARLPADRIVDDLRTGPRRPRGLDRRRGDGRDPADAGLILLEALAAGKDVVTANKALLAEHGPELFAQARQVRPGGRLRGERRRRASRSSRRSGSAWRRTRSRRWRRSSTGPATSSSRR